MSSIINDAIINININNNTNNFIGLKLSGKGINDNSNINNNYDYNGIGINLWSNREIAFIDTSNSNNSDYANIRFGIISNIPKINGSTSIQINNNFTILNNRIGIETLNPNSALHVKNNILLSGSIVDLNNNIFNCNLWVNNANKLYYNKGYIGIGLTNPNSLLDFANSTIILSSNYKIGIGKTNPLNALDIFNNDFNINNGALLCYLSNSKLGLGNTNPQSALDIRGDIILSGSLLNIDGTPYTFKTSNPEQWSNSPNNLDNIYYNLGNVGIGTTNPQSSSLYVNGNIQLDGNIIMSNGTILNSSPWNDITINSSKYIYANNYNFGIGTNEPLDLLHLSLINSNLYIRLTDATIGHTSNDGFIIGLDSNDNGLLWNYENSSLIFGTSNRERLKITNNGFIGIGTTNPQSLLHLSSCNVNTNVFININNDLIIRKDSNQNALLWNNQPTDLIFGTNNEEKLRIKSINSKTSYINNIKKYPPKTYTSSTNINIVNDILNGRSVYTQTITLDTSDITYGYGDYVIYVSSLFDQSDTYNIKYLFNNIIDYNAAFANSAYDANTGYYMGTNNIINDYYGDWVIIKLPYNIILKKYIFYGRNDIGNILSRSPGEWTVYGSFDGNYFTVIDTGTATRNDYINNKYEKIINNNISYLYYGFVINKLALPVSEFSTLLNFGELELYGYENSDILIINEINSNIGIGTNSPNALLQLYKSGITPQNVLLTLNDQGTITTNFIIGKTYDNNLIFWNSNNTPMTFRTNNIERLRITNNGNIGIGTTNPQSLLHLSSCNINTNVLVNINGLIIGKDSNQNGLMWNNDNNDLIFGTSNNEKLRIKSNTNTNNNLKLDNHIDIVTLFNTKPPHSMYFAEDYDAINNILLDSSGNNKTANTYGIINKNRAIGDGATAQINYISGGTTSYIIFPNNSIPTTFTILSLSRYTGGSTGRIIQAQNGNLLHGHWTGYRGVCHYDSWKTPMVSVGTITDWLCCIGKNSGNTPGNILIDGIASGNEAGGIGGYTLSVNNGIYNELSDWAISCIMVWDQSLTDQEIVTLNSMINSYKTLGFSLKNYIANLNVISIADGITINNSNTLLQLYKSGNIPQNILLTLNDQGTSASRFQIGKTKENNCIFWNSNNTAITFRTNNLERLRIANNGNIGIGNNNPLSLLHLTAATTSTSIGIKLCDLNTNNSNKGFFINKDNQQNGIIWNYEDASIIFGNNNTEKMRINAILKLPNHNELFTLFNTKKPYAMYFAEDYDNINKILPDISGNKRNATTSSGITKTVSNENGALSAINYIYGDVNASILFPTNSIPSTFTIASLTKYNGDSYGRILQSTTTSPQFIHGHHNYNRGVCYYDGWKTLYVNKGLLKDWVCCIGKNSGNIPGNILIDGAASGTEIGGNGNCTLCINSSTVYEYSDWALSCVIIWDIALDDTEMVLVNNVIDYYKLTGNSIRNYISSLFNSSNTYNIGLGTNNPNALLHLYKSSNISQDILLNFNDQGTSAFQIGKRDNDNTIFWNSNNTPITFRTNNVERLRIANNGNIGIGIINPQYLLDISSNININGGLAIGSSRAFINNTDVDNTNTSNTYLILKQAGSGSDWCYIRQVGGIDSYKLSFDFYNETDSRFAIRYIIPNAATDTVKEIFNVDITDTYANGLRLNGENKNNTIMQLSSNMGITVNNENNNKISFIIFSKDIMNLQNDTICINNSVICCLLDVYYNGLSKNINGGISDIIILFQGNASTYPYSIGIYNFSLYYSIPNNSYHRFFIDGSDIININSSSTIIYNNISIENTNNPAIYFSSIGVSSICVASGAGAYSANASTGDMIIRSQTGNKLILQTGNTEGNLIIRNGKIGIGTDNPISILDVRNDNIILNGNIYNTNGTLYKIDKGTFTSLTSSNLIMTTNIETSLTPTYTDTNNKYYLFENNGSITFNKTITADILVVGAGGNGGLGYFSGGGGAGEVIYYPKYTFSPGTYNLTIGKNDYTNYYINCNVNNIKLAIGQNSSAIVNNSIKTLFTNKKPWACYFAEDFSGSTLYDSSDNNRHATTTGTITKTTASGNGATANITYISGTTASTLSFPSGSIPTIFTILSLTRYTGGTNRRLLQTLNSGNWFHGHWAGNRGVCYYEEFKNGTNVGTLTDWLCCIGKNSGNTPGNILVDGIGYGAVTGGTGGGTYQLGINTGIGYGLTEQSDWALSCVIIWDQALTDQEMMSLNDIIDNYKSTGIYYSTNRNSIITIGSRDIIRAKGGGDGGTTGLFVSAKPWACYFAEDFSGSTLFDSSGNNRHATTTGTINVQTSSGNGATANITYISGNINSTISFPSGSIPSTFTILSLTRYTGDNYRRILQTQNGGNWLHGYNSGKRGICFYEGLKTPDVSVGTLTDWLCCIGKNSGGIPGNILIDGVASGNATGGTGGGTYRLGINTGLGYGITESSDWALSCVIIWDQALTDIEMNLLNNIVKNYLLSGISIKNNFITKPPFFGGSGGGGYTSNSVITSGSTAGLKWNTNYSYINDGQPGTLLRGGDGGSALPSGYFTEQITENNLKIGKGGLGISNIDFNLFTTKKNYGDGGDGGGGIGANGIIIIKQNTTNNLIATDINTKTLNINNINNSFFNYKYIYPTCSCNLNYTDNNNYGYYLITSTTDITFTKDTIVELLLVGYGGNGGIGANSGGGGAGEVIYLHNYLINRGTYNIQVGNNLLNNGNTYINDTSNIIAKKGGSGLDSIDIVPIIISGSGTINFVYNSLDEKYILLNQNAIIAFNRDIVASIVLIGGGGGGGSGRPSTIGSAAGGGGGAGEYKVISNIYIPANININITVGTGGIGDNRTVINTNGNDTIISSKYFYYNARGGGGGARPGNNSIIGLNGASGGGGGGGQGVGGKSYSFGNTGFNGGNGNLLVVNGYIPIACGGGGGGFSSMGGDALPNAAGNGGTGVDMLITGYLSNVCGGGGGGGSEYVTWQGNGYATGGGLGVYGGGNGGYYGYNATNYGGGGGGGSRLNSVYSYGGNGFSGVCIIRYYIKKINNYSINNFGSTGGGYANINSSFKKPNIYTSYNSFTTSGTNGTITSGGNGGSALSSGAFIETMTNTNINVGIGGNGAIGNSTPIPKTTYGSGGDGNGGLGTDGLVIIKFPIEKINVFNGYQITNDNNYLKILDYTFKYNNEIQLDYYYNKGNVGIGISNPISLLHVNSNIYLSGNINNYYLTPDLIISTPNNTSIIVGDNINSNITFTRNLTSFVNQNVFITGNLTVNGNITVTSSCNISINSGGAYYRNSTILTSSSTNFSDNRIKTNITDINSNNASLLISNIMPKIYNYIDKEERGDVTVYGFIAQQIQEVIPPAVKTITEFIPNIYKSFIYSNNEIIIDEDLTLQLSINDRIKIKDADNYYKIVNITNITSNTITLNTSINGSNCFIYGKEIKDFHILDKSYIYTTNIGSTQNLYETVKKQEQQLLELNNILEQQEDIFNKISQKLNLNI